MSDKSWRDDLGDIAFDNMNEEECEKFLSNLEYGDSTVTDNILNIIKNKIKE